MLLQVKPLGQRRIKLNRDLGRKTSTEERPASTSSQRPGERLGERPVDGPASSSTISPASEPGDRRERPASGERRERLEATERGGGREDRRASCRERV